MGTFDIGAVLRRQARWRYPAQSKAVFNALTNFYHGNQSKYQLSLLQQNDGKLVVLSLKKGKINSDRNILTAYDV